MGGESNATEDVENKTVFVDDDEGLTLTRGEIARVVGVGEASQNTKVKLKRLS